MTKPFTFPFGQPLVKLNQTDSIFIKNILTVLIPELSYGDVEVQDGMSASTTYANLSAQPKNEQKKIRQALLDYFHLDTLAMVRILEKIKQTI